MYEQPLDLARMVGYSRQSTIQIYIVRNDNTI